MKGTLKFMTFIVIIIKMSIFYASLEGLFASFPSVPILLLESSASTVRGPPLDSVCPYQAVVGLPEDWKNKIRLLDWLPKLENVDEFRGFIRFKTKVVHG